MGALNIMIIRLQCGYKELCKRGTRKPNESKISDIDSQLRRINGGAHIASKRKDGCYDHHGIKREGNWVIHFQGPWKSPGNPPRCEICDYQPPMNGGVVESCIDCFLRDQSLIILEYKIRILWENLNKKVMDSLIPGKAIYAYNSKKIYLRLYKEEQLYGHLKIPKKDSSKYEIDHGVYYYECSSARSPNQIMQKAQELLNDGLNNYNLVFRNCEHFATYCTTGKPRSIQVEKALSKISCNGNGRQLYKSLTFLHKLFQKAEKKKKLLKRLGKHYGNRQAIELASAADGIRGCKPGEHSCNEPSPCDRYSHGASHVDEDDDLPALIDIFEQVIDFSSEIQGTEVARESSNIVVLDDNASHEDEDEDLPAPLNISEEDTGLSRVIQGTEVARESSENAVFDDISTTVVTFLRWGINFLLFLLTIVVAALLIDRVAAVSSDEVLQTAVSYGISLILQLVIVEFPKRVPSTAGRLNWGKQGACIRIAAPGVCTRIAAPLAQLLGLLSVFQVIIKPLLHFFHL